MAKEKNQTPRQPLRVELSFESAAAAVEACVVQLLEFLRPHIAQNQLPQFELALSEVLRNAFEHGNLGISREEKIRLCEAGTFDAEVERRSSSPELREKRITVLAEVSDGAARFQISDQGRGFDWRRSPAPAPSAESLEQLNGRGLILIHQFFDQVGYNDAGNSVICEKRLR